MFSKIEQTPKTKQLPLMKRSLKKVKNPRNLRKKSPKHSPTVLSLRKLSVKNVCITSECLDLDLSWLFALNSIHAFMKLHSMLVSPTWSQSFQDKRNKIMKRRNSRKNNKPLKKRRIKTKMHLISYLITETGPKLKPNPSKKERFNTLFA
jgi:hypothetical protein